MFEGTGLRLSRRLLARKVSSTSLEEMDDQWIALVRRRWGNESFSARQSLLRTIVDFGSKLAAGMQVVEIGSGLTTLLLHRICELRGAKLVSLEHVAEWKRLMDRLLGDRDVVVHAPLASYGDFDWYALPQSFPAGPFDMVVVDAPPEKATPGGRFGLLPVLGPRMGAHCITIIDDFRPEKPWIAKWREKYSASFHVTGDLVATMDWIDNR
jgi:hypothetical protein